MLECDATLAETVVSEPEQIARALRQRDVAVLQGLVEQYQHRLVRYLIYLLGQRGAVDDLVQETWLRVLERGRSYDGRSRFEPWLFTIARNLAIDTTRRRQILSLDANDEAGEEVAVPVSGEPSPFEQAARTEDSQRLAGSLATLQPVYREALLLRFQEELSLEEIAGVMGASVSTVASRIYRGLAALRAQMEEGDHAG